MGSYNLKELAMVSLGSKIYDLLNVRDIDTSIDIEVDNDKVVVSVSDKNKINSMKLIEEMSDV